MLALPAIVSVPVRWPLTVGVKVTDTVQFAPGANSTPTQLAAWKLPVAVMLANVSGTVALAFVTVTFFELLVFTCWLGKLRLV